VRWWGRVSAAGLLEHAAGVGDTLAPEVASVLVEAPQVGRKVVEEAELAFHAPSLRPA
jgi:hypothetical protein